MAYLQGMLCKDRHAFFVRMGHCGCMWQRKERMNESAVPFLDVFSVALKLLDFLLEIGFVLLFLSSTVRIVHLKVWCAILSMKGINEEL